jgi:hypothetical protein
MKRLYWAALFIFNLSLTFGQSETDELWYLNQLRVDAGFSLLAVDPVLERTAALFAAELKDRGVLTHRGKRYKTALQRYQAQGGTTVRIGEILGSGSEWEQVVEAWLESPQHYEVLFDERWTHQGLGTADLGNLRIWVVLFNRQELTALQFQTKEGGLFLSGRLEKPKGIQPLIIAGLSVRQADLWNTETRSFQFFIPRSQWSLYHRLGYRDQAGVIRISDAFYPVEVITSFLEKVPQ